jgi:hypothetical protein
VLPGQVLSQPSFRSSDGEVKELASLFVEEVVTVTNLFFKQSCLLNLTVTTWRSALPSCVVCLSISHLCAVSFTIGPKSPQEDLEGFKTYATKLSDLEPSKVADTIGGVIHGEQKAEGSR